MNSKYRALLINIAAAIALFLVGVLLAGEFEGQTDQTKDADRTLTVGWDVYYPYQFGTGDPDTHRPSGLDTELVREVCRRSGYSVKFEQRTWSDSVMDVEKGTLDGISLAFKTQNRERYARFTEPFFSMRSALFFRRDTFTKLPSDCEQLRNLIRDKQLVVGYTRGYAFTPEIDAMLKDPDIQKRARAETRDGASLDALKEGVVDLVIADQLSGTSVVLRNGWNNTVGCVALDVPSVDAHLMFSKATVSQQTVDDMNKALATMRDDGTRAEIVRAYYYPAMLNMLAHAFWFDEISLLAVAAAAVSGLFLARKMGTNLLGAFLLAAAPAAGGGLMRDLVAGRRPVAVVADPSILLLVVFLVLFAFIVFRVIDRRLPQASAALDHMDIDGHPVLVFFDGLGLAAFTVIGVLVAMQWHCEPLWLWGPILAALTNGGGSALRDIILRRPVGMVLSTRPYVEVSILWGGLLSCYLTYSSRELPYTVTDLQLAILTTLLGVGITYMVVRLAGVRSPAYGILPDHAATLDELARLPHSPDSKGENV